ncbi:hypothetical protein QOT17_006093 [Balamuthia mandrillaris]
MTESGYDSSDMERNRDEEEEVTFGTESEGGGDEEGHLRQLLLTKDAEIARLRAELERMKEQDSPSASTQSSSKIITTKRKEKKERKEKDAEENNLTGSGRHKSIGRRLGSSVVRRHRSKLEGAATDVESSDGETSGSDKESTNPTRRRKKTGSLIEGFMRRRTATTGSAPASPLSSPLMKSVNNANSLPASSDNVILTKREKKMKKLKEKRRSKSLPSDAMDKLAREAEADKEEAAEKRNETEEDIEEKGKDSAVADRREVFHRKRSTSQRLLRTFLIKRDAKDEVEVELIKKEKEKERLKAKLEEKEKAKKQKKKTNRRQQQKAEGKAKERTDIKEERLVCKLGKNCKEEDPEHFIRYSHTPTIKEKNDSNAIKRPTAQQLAEEMEKEKAKEEKGSEEEGEEKLSDYEGDGAEDLEIVTEENVRVTVSTALNEAEEEKEKDESEEGEEELEIVTEENERVKVSSSLDEGQDGTQEEQEGTK